MPFIIETNKKCMILLLLMVYYKIALDESELRNYLQTLVKNIKKYLVLQALYYNNCLLIYELISQDKYTFIFTKFTKFTSYVIEYT